MYANIRSCVSVNGNKSGFFKTNCGVRQGENLSPLLFSIFLNDIECYLKDLGNRGLDFSTLHEEMTTMLKIIVLLYADDTILISDDPAKFQKCLNDFANYCQMWKLNINTEKTKIVVFGSNSSCNYHFTLNKINIELVSTYKYLGTYFSKSGTFLAARKHFAQQARKALYLVYKRTFNLNLPLDLMFKLFDHTILPILTYSSEIWGYEDTQILERIHCEFIRKILKLKKSTPLYMLYGETGRYPMSIMIKTRMIGFWNKLITGNQNKLSYQIYKFMLNVPNFKSKWVEFIKTILNQCGMGNVWIHQTSIQHNTIKLQVKQTLQDQYLQHWHATLQESHKGRNYSIFKTTISLEPYLINLNRADYLNLIKFRTGNHRLPVETGRWNKVHYHDRKCPLCNSNDVGDEMHYLLLCPFFESERKILIKKYYYKRPNTLKYKEILTINTTSQLHKLAVFVRKILSTW